MPSASPTKHLAGRIGATNAAPGPLLQQLYLSTEEEAVERNSSPGAAEKTSAGSTITVKATVNSGRNADICMSV